ncbi:MULTISPECIES: sigma-70 family RNA polymerase sigma factor [unclassified Ligilactobacillus]|uniref:sigma-70 family RNA polymerase sigma factor n=1 Tax=unclassified Ligilactobacillus TaxID=2767920 RepID=UPI0038546634
MANTRADLQLWAYYASPTSANFNALFDQYSPLVRSMLSRVRFIPGYDWDDLEQEARIVCWRAVTSFSLTNDVSFGAYFRVCLAHCIAGLIREAHTQKRGVAFATTSLEHFVDTRGIHPSDTIAHASSAEDIVILREWLRLYTEQLNVREAFLLRNFLTEPHCSVSTLARQMQCSRSSVYSLIYRCKVKLRQSSSQ